ncbi:hypothetical protein ACMA1D_10625 [Streptomyces sp. 796.1]|uniref:hypothetical protein n=1 Tax=Streptomyces sp. 796.1 TaxID=3163029 RepID=UPI0039C8CDDC
MTFVGNAILTAAQLNTHLRDNLLETAPAKATTEGGYFVASGPNAIVERVAQVKRANGLVSTSSTSFVPLSGGPAVTATTSTTALVFHGCRLENTGTGASLQSWAVSGATTRAALLATTILLEGISANNFCIMSDVDLMTGLTPGVNTFTCQYRAGSGTASFQSRFIAVMPL